MIDATQVYVRGFETQENGKQIESVLEDFGFTVTESFDEREDDRGGLIETNICNEVHLAGDLNALREAVFAVAPPGTFIQHRTFRLAGKGEFHGTKVRVHQHQEQ